MLEDTKLLWVVKLLLEFYELIAGILGEAAVSLWGLDGAHVDLCLVRACGSIVTWELRVKYGIVLTEQRLEVGSDSLRENAAWVYVDGCGVTSMRGW